uniref:Ig-like domain-containing protein n=1 Tax=Periophthalmus magnuspinnatus TaxID=409849 RepID=A0A3B4BGU6_9GOBI
RHTIFLFVLCFTGVLSVSTSTGYGPKQLRAFNGSCLHIPCHFKGKSRNVVAKWFKNQTTTDNLIFNSHNETEIKVPVKLVGDLTQENCSTVFYNLTTKDSDTYYLTLENEKKAFNITIKESPKRPVITILGEQHENSLVTLTCCHHTPCPQAPPTLMWDVSQAPPTLTWALPPGPSQLIANSNGSFTTIIQLHNLILTHLHHRQPIKCLAQYPVTGGIKTSKIKLQLNVTCKLYAPKNTQASVSLSGGLWSSQTVSLTCSSTAHPPVQNFSWFKVSTQGAIHVHDGHLYSFNITSSGHFYCVEYNRLGNQSSSVIGKLDTMFTFNKPLLLINATCPIVFMSILFYFHVFFFSFAILTLVSLYTCHPIICFFS